MVCIFFVISGIALSLKPARLAREGQQHQLYKTLGSMAFRRGIRLFLPCFIASFVHMVMAHASWCDVQSVQWEGPAEIFDEFWLKQPEHVPSLIAQISQWLAFFIDKILIPSTWRGTTTGRDYGDLEHVEYGSQLWTVGIEFWSSILLVVVLLGTASLRLITKSLLMAAFTSFSLWVGRWDVALFLFGGLLGHATTFDHPSKGKRNEAWEYIVFGLLFCFGLHLASFPELGGSQTPGFSWLPLMDNSRLWQSVGASLIVLSSVNLRVLKKLFSCRAFLYLGRISFAIYITHVPFLGTVGWRLVALLRMWFGGDTYGGQLASAIASLLILFPLQVWVADTFCRFVDEPCNYWALRIYNHSTIVT
jgi:peptidoglycan/LPS O-acetylase OafA/YrhL